MTATPEPGNRDVLADYFASMRELAAGDPVLLARVDAAAAAAQPTGGEADCADCRHGFDRHGEDEEAGPDCVGVGTFGDCSCEGYRTPSAGQDTGQRVPTNAELAERARSATAHDVVRGWLGRHVGVYAGLGHPERDKWLDWAAANFLTDPEVAQHVGPLARLVAERDELRCEVERSRRPTLHLDAVKAERDEARATVQRVEKLARQYRRFGEELHDVPRAESFADVALDLRRALDGPA